MAEGFKAHIEGLSDLVFGLALSIGGIALLNLTLTSESDVFFGLFWFTFSFLILIGMWMTYSQIMDAVRLETDWAMRLNIALLLLVIIEPFLLNIIAFDDSFRDSDALMGFATMIYALDLGAIFAIMAGLFHIAVMQHPGDLVALRKERNGRVVTAAVFLVSALPLFWSVTVMDQQLRYIIWFLSWPIGFIADRVLFMGAAEGEEERSKLLER